MVGSNESSPIVSNGFVVIEEILGVGDIDKNPLSLARTGMEHT
jgi:hypothetical protein